MMPTAQQATTAARYAKCVEVSKRIRWDTDRDVIRGRNFDFGKKLLPDGLSKADRLPFLTPAEKHLYSQVQGRTYADMFALVERFIGAKVLELTRGHALGDQVALEALVRLSDEELKQQEMFRRLETMIAPGMPGDRGIPQGQHHERPGRQRGLVDDLRRVDPDAPRDLFFLKPVIATLLGW